MNVLLVFLLVSTLAASPLPLPSPETSAFRGTPKTLSVQLKSQNGRPIENANVLFFHETHNELLGSDVTNSTGFAKFIWMIPITHELGPVQLNATFRGDPERYLLPSMVPIPLTVFAQLQNDINVTEENGNPIGSVVRLGQRLFFHTLITDDNSSPLGAVTVQFIMEPNQILAQKTTPINGSLVFSCILNQTTDSYITFTIRSLNQGYYNGTTSSFNFLIQNYTVHFTGLPTYWHPSDGYSLQGILETSSGQTIPNASIELLFESGILLKTTKTEDNGHFLFDLYDVIGFIQGNRYFIIRYNGTPGYSRTESFIGIIAISPYNPFIQTLEYILSLLEHPLLYRISIVTISCLAIGSSVLTLRLRRTTKRIVSH